MVEHSKIVPNSLGIFYLVFLQKFSPKIVLKYMFQDLHKIIESNAYSQVKEFIKWNIFIYAERLKNV